MAGRRKILGGFLQPAAECRFRTPNQSSQVSSVEACGSSGVAPVPCADTNRSLERSPTSNGGIFSSFQDVVQEKAVQSAESSNRGEKPEQNPSTLHCEDRNADRFEPLQFLASSLDELRFLASEDPPCFSCLSRGWSEAKTGRRLSRFELREALDGFFYTADEFKAHYTGTLPLSWSQMWEQATVRIPPRLSLEEGLFLNDEGDLDEDEVYLHTLIKPPSRVQKKTRWCSLEPEPGEWRDDHTGPHAYNFMMSDDESQETNPESSRCLHSLPLVPVQKFRPLPSIPLRFLRGGDTKPSSLIKALCLQPLTTPPRAVWHSGSVMRMKDPRTSVQPSAGRISGSYRENAAKDHPEEGAKDQPQDMITTLENFCAKKKLPKPTYKNVNENREPSQSHLPEWRCTLTILEDEVYVSKRTYRKEREAMREVATSYIHNIDSSEYMPKALSSDPAVPAVKREEDCPEAIYCPTCDMWLNGPSTFNDHTKGKKHNKRTLAISASAAARFLVVGVISGAATAVDSIRPDEPNTTSTTGSASVDHVEQNAVLKLEGFLARKILWFTGLVAQEIGDITIMYNQYQASVVSGVHYAFAMFMWSTIILLFMLLLFVIYGYIMCDNTSTANTAFKADADIPKCLKCSKLRFQTRDQTNTRVFFATANDKCTHVKVALVSSRCTNCSRFPRSYGSEPVRFYTDEQTNKLMHVFSAYRQSEDLESEQLKAKKNFNSCLVGAMSAMPTHATDSATAFSQLAGGLNSQQHLIHKAGFLPFKSWCRSTESYMQATPWNPRILDEKGVPLPETQPLFPQSDKWEKVRVWGVENFPWLFGPEDLEPIPEATAPEEVTIDDLMAMRHLPGMTPRSENSDDEQESFYTRWRDWLVPSRSQRSRELVILREQLARLARPPRDPLYASTVRITEYDAENPPTPPAGQGFAPGTFTGLEPSHHDLPGQAREVQHFSLDNPRARELPPPYPRGHGPAQQALATWAATPTAPAAGVRPEQHFAEPPFDENTTSHLSQSDRHAAYVNAVEFQDGSIPTIARSTLEPGRVIAAYTNLSAPGVEQPNGSIPTSGLQYNASSDLVASGLITGLQGTHQIFPASRAPVLASEIENGAKIVFVFDETVGQTCVACGPIVGQPTVWNSSDPMSKLQALEHRIEVDIDPRCYCFKKCASDVKGCRQCGEGTDGKCCSCSGELVGKAYQIRALYHMRATTLCTANLHKYRLNGCVGCDPESAGRPVTAIDLEAQHCLNKVLLGQKVHDSELAALFPDGIYNGDYCTNEHMTSLEYDDYKRERIKFLECIREKVDKKEIARAKKWAKENLEKEGDGKYTVCKPGLCPNGQPLMFRGSSSTGLRYSSLWSAIGAKACSFSRQIEAFNLVFGKIDDIRDVFKHTKFSPEEIDEAIFNLKMLITEPDKIQSRTANTKGEVIVGKECTEKVTRKNRVKNNRLTTDTKANKARLVYDNGIELMVLSHVITKVFQVLLYSKEMGIFYQYSIKEQDREETVNRHLKKMMAKCSGDGKVKWDHESCMAELDQTGWERHQKEYKGRNNGLMSPVIGILQNICRNVAHFSPLFKEIATMYQNKISWDVNHGLVFDLKVPCVSKGNRGKTNIRVKLPELQVDSGWTLTSGINFASEITGVLASAFTNPEHILCQAGPKDHKRQAGEFHNVSLPDQPGIDKDNDFGMKYGGHTFNDTFKTVPMHWKEKFESVNSEFLALVEGDDFAARMHRAFSLKKNSDIFENNQADLGASAKWKCIVNGRVELIGVHAPVVDGMPVADGAGIPLWIPDLTKSLTKLGCKVGTDNSKAAQVSRFAALAAVYYKKNLPLGTIFREAAMTIADSAPAEMAKATVLVKEYDELNRAGFQIGKHDMKGVLSWMAKECQGNAQDVIQEVMLMNTSIKGHPYPAESENPLDFRTWGHLMTVAQSSKGKTFRDSVEIYNMLPEAMRPKFV